MLDWGLGGACFPLGLVSVGCRWSLQNRAAPEARELLSQRSDWPSGGPGCVALHGHVHPRALVAPRCPLRQGRLWRVGEQEAAAPARARVQGRGRTGDDEEPGLGRHPS